MRNFWKSIFKNFVSLNDFPVLLIIIEMMENVIMIDKWESKNKSLEWKLSG